MLCVALLQNNYVFTQWTEEKPKIDYMIALCAFPTSSVILCQRTCRTVHVYANPKMQRKHSGAMYDDSKSLNAFNDTCMSSCLDAGLQISRQSNCNKRQLHFIVLSPKSKSCHYTVFWTRCSRKYADLADMNQEVNAQENEVFW
jgi:hypothetical protein